MATVASEIRQHIIGTAQPEGARLAERKLGDLLKVSRSPIRSALQLLEEEGTVRRAGSGGYFVGAVRPHATLEPSIAEQRYLRLAGDRLEGRIPRRVTENQLLREYGFSRSELTAILRRISAEGWIERTPGYGWEFLPVLDSLEAYQDSYRYRLVIEPAAILEPSFTLDSNNLTRFRADQLALIDGGIWNASPAAIYDCNSTLHEAIIDCANNSFLSDGLRRANRLRRLIEYKQALPRERALVRCREHIDIVDLLLAGKNDRAARLMKDHLGSVAIEKTAPTTCR